MLQTSIRARALTGNSSGWTDNRAERLKTFWADGRSASEIAALLGEVSRCAVIGKIHRLGLPGRKTASRQPRRTSPRRDRAGRVSIRMPVFIRPLPVPPIDLPPAPAALMLSVAQLTGATCHWPVGDPLLPGFGFCGCQKAPGAPYCEHHAAIAYNPAARRGRYA
jgi:GcrA cell cycle regulator